MSVKVLKVGYKRVFQGRSFESQSIELSVEEEKDVPVGRTVVEGLRELYKQLEAVGDKLMADALAKPDPGGRR